MLESTLAPQLANSVKGLLDSWITVSTQSLPLPSYELPIVTSSSKARYVAVERCAKPAFGQYQRRACCG